jgi:hypothetical protein
MPPLTRLADRRGTDGPGDAVRHGYLDLDGVVHGNRDGFFLVGEERDQQGGLGRLGESRYQQGGE